MTPLLDALGEWVINHYAWRHFVVALGILIQGEITVFIATYLILNKYLGVGGFFLAILTGLIFYEGFFYLLGRALKDKPLGAKLEEKIVKSRKMQFYLHNHMDHLLIISKFLVYVNVGTILLSGLMKMDFKKFLKNRIAANGLWLATILISSYLILSGLTLLNLQQVEIGAAIILALIFAAHYLIRNRILKETAVK